MHPSDIHVYMATIVLAIATASIGDYVGTAVLLALTGLLYYDQERHESATAGETDE